MEDRTITARTALLRVFHVDGGALQQWKLPRHHRCASLRETLVDTSTCSFPAVSKYKASEQTTCIQC
eukprot:1398735-Amphidinium_carterae.1